MRDDEIDVSNCPQLVVIAGGSVIDDLELEFGMALLIRLTPRLEIGREFVVGHDVNGFHIGKASEIVHQPFDDRFAANHKERFCFVQCQRIKARGVSGSENQNVHEIKRVRSKTEKRSSFLYALAGPRRIVSFKCCCTIRIRCDSVILAWLEPSTT